MKQLAEVQHNTLVPLFRYCSCATPFPIRHEFKGYRYCMNCELTIKEGS